MKLRHRIAPRKTVAELFETFDSYNHSDSNLGEFNFLSDLIHVFRPKRKEKIEVVSIRELLDYLHQNESIRTCFVAYLKEIFLGKGIKSILTDSGILQNASFSSEIKKRLFAKILPYQPQKDTLEFVLNQIFYQESDIQWLQKIPMEELIELVDLLEFSTLYDVKFDNLYLLKILEVNTLLAQRVSGRALESEVLKMVPEFHGLESPFEGFEKELDQIEHRFRERSVYFLSPNDLDFKQLMILHKQCNEYIEVAFKNSSKFGISMLVNQSLLRIKQQLYRIQILLQFLTIQDEAEKKEKTIQFALKLIKYNCLKNNVSKLISESTQLISYEITQHTAKTGEHYITESKREYFHMLYTAMGGGLIVGILCVLKLLLGFVHVSDFGHAFLYSMNYAIGFIVIYLLGYTLATKQPAMTAATLVKSIEIGMKSNASEKNKHMAFASLFARLFRSQFIAFVGNVIIAFPVSLLLIYLIDLLFSTNIAAAKHEKLIYELSPVHSMAIFHASIAGVFLFLSGVISGSISNKNKHIQLYYRIEENPTLKITFGKQKAKNIAAWFEKKWAGVASNFWFGVFLGTTASVGIFFGLNLDIRHITFASGNLALGLYGADFHVSGWMIFWGIFGIGLIGFFNFIVSFLLSLGLAFRSREIPLLEIRFLFLSVWAYFKKHPSLFFFPVRERGE